MTESEPADQFRLVSLAALVRMKLAAFRDKDRTHLRDLIEVGLLDSSMRDKLGKVFIAPVDVVLDEENTVQPDILFIALHDPFTNGGRRMRQINYGRSQNDVIPCRHVAKALHGK